MQSEPESESEPSSSPNLLLLSPVVDGNDDKTKNNSSSRLSVNAKTTYTCKRRRSSRHRSCGLSPTYLEVDCIDKNEDDTPMGDDDDNDELTKRTKGTITHKKRQKEKWNEMLQKLDSYKKKHKSTNVPNRYAEDNHSLGRWVSSQRMFYNKKTLSIDRINHLESIGFVWNPLDARWMEMYQKLVAYKKQYRSTKVPVGYTEDPQLGQWISDQRVFYRKNKLSDKRTVLLESIGFVWDPWDRQWMEMYNRLVAYKKQYKHTNVPKIYPADPQLGIWTKNNRHLHKKNTLTEKRIELLNSIKFS